MKQNIFLTVKTILLLILGLLIYPAFLAARESKIEMSQKIPSPRYRPLIEVHY